MLITYLRSSSYTCDDDCPQRYLLDYVLGFSGPANAAAIKGSVVHKVLEIFALVKKAEQDGLDYIYDGDVLKKKLIRDIPEDMALTDHVFDFYASNNKHLNWSEKDKSDCRLWVRKTLSMCGGIFDPRDRTIVQPEQEFDIEIPYEWANYSYKLEDGSLLEGKLRIKGTIDLLVQVDNDFYEIIDWKGLPVTTEIPTIDGWKTMGELSIGDIIFDELGKPTKILGKSQVKHKDCYKVTFDDTTTAISDDEHLWKLNDGKVVKTTELKRGDSIDIAKPLQTESRELPIDPYLLGIWLGDGRNRNGEICNSDSFIFDEIKRRGYELGENINNRIEICQVRTVVGLTKKLRGLDLLYNKHIPLEYLRSSYIQRLDLLRGLMDSDGNVNKTRKQAVFTSCDKRLSDDVKELLLTLGQRPLQSLVYNRQFGRDISIFPLSFRPIDLNPFLLPRKANNIDGKWNYGNSDRRLIKKIDYIGKQDTQCIKVDSELSTYLCTRNMIPTHNTGRKYNWGKGVVKTDNDLKKDPQLMLYHYAATLLYPNISDILVTINFINDGGPTSVAFTKKDIKKTEEMLKTKFEKIKNTKIPRLNKGWKCTKFCHHGKTTFDGTNIEPQIEDRENQVTPMGEYRTKCEQTKYMVEKKGLDWVTKHYTKEGHCVANYKAPGAV